MHGEHEDIEDATPGCRDEGGAAGYSHGQVSHHAGAGGAKAHRGGFRAGIRAAVCPETSGGEAHLITAENQSVRK